MEERKTNNFHFEYFPIWNSFASLHFGIASQSKTLPQIVFSPEIFSKLILKLIFQLCFPVRSSWIRLFRSCFEKWICRSRVYFINFMWTTKRLQIASENCKQNLNTYLSELTWFFWHFWQKQAFFYNVRASLRCFFRNAAKLLHFVEISEWVHSNLTYHPTCPNDNHLIVRTQVHCPQ